MLAKFIDTPREDSLTAAVFSHLLHLPAELFWDILRQACYYKKLPAVAGEPQQVDPWPSWKAAGTANNSRVVPDLFIRFADFDLIIEAKRRDDWMQNPAQWRNQLIAYTNEYGEEKQTVHLLALGGLHQITDDRVVHRWQSADSADSHVFECPVHMCRWSRLLAQCQRAMREREKLVDLDSRQRATLRILRDTIELFGAHGFATGMWFADLRETGSRLSSVTADHHAIFRRCSLQLTTS